MARKEHLDYKRLLQSAPQNRSSNRYAISYASYKKHKKNIPVVTDLLVPSNKAAYMKLFQSHLTNHETLLVSNHCWHMLE